MNETKSKLISFAVLLALFLTAVAFASHYDGGDVDNFAKQPDSQQNSNTSKKKKTKNSNSANSNMMNSNTEPNTNATPN